MPQPFLNVRQQSATYPVYIGAGLLDEVGALVRPRGRVFVMTSLGLRARFGDRVASTFDPPATVIAIEEGESRKTLDTANEIVTQLLDAGARRDSLAVVVGGGMLGDTAGFAASIFLRGIDLVHVPTTLLSQVDSSIGGKVGVNHPRGKNLIGSFHPPRAVIIDPLVLRSLAARELISGALEALKAGVIADPELFALIERCAADSLRERDSGESPAAASADALLENAAEIVRRAIKVKADIVSADERENDQRRLLNYGHTIGHGIEAVMNFEGITHGEAVGWGMIGANEIAVQRALLAEQLRNRIDRATRALLPATLPLVLDATAILRATDQDKKNTGSTRVMVLPAAIGSCEIVAGITEGDVRLGIEAALRPRRV